MDEHCLIPSSHFFAIEFFEKIFATMLQAPLTAVRVACSMLPLDPHERWSRWETRTTGHPRKADTGPAGQATRTIAIALRLSRRRPWITRATAFDLLLPAFRPTLARTVCHACCILVESSEYRSMVFKFGRKPSESPTSSSQTQQCSVFEFAIATTVEHFARQHASIVGAADRPIGLRVVHRSDR